MDVDQGDASRENLARAQALSPKVLSSVKAGGTLILAILINLALIPVVMFYLLRDWNIILARFEELTPRRWLATLRTVAVEVDDVLAEFLRGQASVMVVLAIYYVIALWIAGLQFWLPIGILTGLLVFIPYVGFGLGLVLGVLAALLQWHGLPGFVAVLAVYGVGQLLEGYVLVPWLVGDRIGLHPVAVIFALLAFGEVFGFAGVLLALAGERGAAGRSAASAQHRTASLRSTGSVPGRPEYGAVRERTAPSLTDATSAKSRRWNS